MGTLALDIGGVNLKGVHSQGVAATRRYLLTDEPEQLSEELQSLIKQFPTFDDLLITMTAELCDCYSTKRAGVEHIIRAVQSIVRTELVHIWLTKKQFVDPSTAVMYPFQSAAANWHALATAIGRMYPDQNVLLIDTGSTTTDITFIAKGKVSAKGLTDHDRLATGELVYIGVNHTPVCILGPTIVWEEKEIGLMSEPFSNMADVIELINTVDSPMANTPNGNRCHQQTIQAATRLARMVGADLEQLEFNQIVRMAHVLFDIAADRISQSIHQVMDSRDIDMVMIAGNGEQLALAAANLTCHSTPKLSLSKIIGPGLSESACAWALLFLHGSISFPPGCNQTG